MMLPADLQRIHRSVLNDTMTGMISEETRAVVESLWPELLQAAAEGRLIAHGACAIRRRIHPGTSFHIRN